MKIPITLAAYLLSLGIAVEKVQKAIDMVVGEVSDTAPLFDPLSAALTTVFSEVLNPVSAADLARHAVDELLNPRPGYFADHGRMA